MHSLGFIYLFLYYTQLSQLGNVQGLHDEGIKLKTSTFCLIPEHSQLYIQ